VKVAVTGGGGFLGAATIAQAELQGHEAWRFDRSDGNDVLGDLRGLSGADVVIHMAGMLGTDELFDTPEEAVQANVVGTLRVLEWCKKHDAGFVGITMPDSSWANVYQATKLCALRLATAWHRNFGVPVSHVRAFNAYGPGQKVGPGHPQKFVPTFATQAWRGEPLTIWGSGNQTVDAVHVDDVARMLVDACMFEDDEVLDAGTGQAVTVNRIANSINRYTGNQGGVIHLPMRRGEEPETHIIAKGEGWEKTGWQPEFSWERIFETVEWYRPTITPATETT
jgi:nucleoside-diphosphate-sugar epimerase